MRLIVKYHPEINIKSRSVRKRFSKLLESNLRIIVKRLYPSAHVIARWSDVVIETKDDISPWPEGLWRWPTAREKKIRESPLLRVGGHRCRLEAIASRDSPP